MCTKLHLAQTQNVLCQNQFSCHDLSLFNYHPVSVRLGSVKVAQYNMSAQPRLINHSLVREHLDLEHKKMSIAIILNICILVILFLIERIKES